MRDGRTDRGSAVETSEQINNHAGFIWSVADLLRGDYKAVRVRPGDPPTHRAPLARLRAQPGKAGDARKARAGEGQGSELRPNFTHIQLFAALGCLHRGGPNGFPAVASVSVKRYAAVSAILALALTSCWIEPPGRPGVVNDTDQDIEVYILDHNRSRDDVLAASLQPGGSITPSGTLVGPCTEETLVARIPNGEEIERREPGLCEGEFWSVNGDPND